MLLVPPENITVRVGNTASLPCSFLANPNDGTIHWQWGDVNLPSSSDKYSIFANGTLIIRETTDDDIGEYQCTVTNSKGNVTAKANLTVISKFTAVNCEVNVDAELFVKYIHFKQFSNTSNDCLPQIIGEYVIHSSVK